MCYFDNAQTMEHIKDATMGFTASGRVFTGYDVKRSTPALAGESTWKVSSYVRELFNNHSPVFDGYACHPIPGGPLLFFPFEKTSRKVRSYAEEIERACQAQAQEAARGKETEGADAEATN